MGVSKGMHKRYMCRNTYKMGNLVQGRKLEIEIIFYHTQNYSPPNYKFVNKIKNWLFSGPLCN